ncbi:hypothetical protein ACFVTM_04235 [Arthrobacter sp. NPDC058130]|uniref:hypothetical protein n=1 Tax=Arthrobacter sp. NPDC058130 TaxID=3346353 RepID=UPI0036E35008
MDQRTRPRLGRFPRALVPAGIVSTAAAGSATAHLVAAVSGPAGAMAWWMAAMGVACLACAAPMVSGRRCAGRTAGHLLAMSAAMVLIHLVLLMAPGTAGHHRTEGTASLPGHAHAMLTLIAVELLCLMSASAALRLTRRQTSGTSGAAARAAVEH